MAGAEDPVRGTVAAVARRNPGRSRARCSGLLAAIAATVLAGCSQWGQRTELTVGYYAVEGSSFEDFDRQIALHGPTVSGIGKALAATTIRMAPDIRYRTESGQCVVADARIHVKAHVTLPRLTRPEQVKKELAGAWGNLEEYTRLHESVHVAIADAHAIRAEKAIKALPPAPDCPTMHARAEKEFDLLMLEHEAEQQRFDAEERAKIFALVARSRSQANGGS